MKTSNKILLALAGSAVLYLSLLYGETAYKGTRSDRVKEEIQRYEDPAYFRTKFLKIRGNKKTIRLRSIRSHGDEKYFIFTNNHFKDTLVDVEPKLSGDTLVFDYSNCPNLLPSNIKFPPIFEKLFLENSVSFIYNAPTSKGIDVFAERSKVKIGNLNLRRLGIRHLEVSAADSRLLFSNLKVEEMELELKNSKLDVEDSEFERSSVKKDEASSIRGYTFDKALAKESR